MYNIENTHLPKLSPEVIEEIRIYQSKNRPIMEELLDYGCIQYNYSDGFVIEENNEGNIIRTAIMSKDRLESLLDTSRKLKESFEPSIIRAKKIKETAIH